MNLHKETVEEIVLRLKNPKDEMPTDEDIKSAVQNNSDAQTVLWRLRIIGYSKGNSQLAMQRALDRRVLALDHNLTLVTP